MAELRVKFVSLVTCVLAIINLVSSSPSTCMSKECQSRAIYILSNMDKDVNPCDNFYDFACGNFVRKKVIRPDRSSAQYLMTIEDELTDALTDIIENQIKDDDPETFKKLKSFYTTCMNEEQLERMSEQEFFEIYKKLGGWPLFEGHSWNEDNFDWKNITLELRKIGYPFSSIIHVEIDVDWKNNSKYKIHLDQPILGLMQEYLSQGIKDDVVLGYYDYMIEIAKIFEIDEKEAEEELEDSLLFEIELSKISLSENDRRKNRTKLYNLVTVEELENKYPYLPWKDYLNQVLEPETSLENTDTVIVRVPSFFEQLGPLLNRTPKRVLANYLFWRLTAFAGNFLSDRFDIEARKLEALMTGTSVKPPRSETCLSHATTLLGPALGALYVRKHTDRKIKVTSLDLIRRIRESLQKIIEELDWMDGKTKSIALEKLSKMALFIAYPDEFLDNEKLDTYYKDLHVLPDSLLGSVLNINLFSLQNSIKSFKKPVDKYDWTGMYGQNVPVVNAFYRPESNAIVFSAGIMQGGVFDENNPKYVNYAGMGIVIGHEITHGFDDSGRAFDKDGNLFDWWDPKTSAAFEEKAKCIVDQYSNYTVPEIGMNVNGEFTLGENIGDNGGIKETYLAYEKWERENGEEPRLPTLEHYTPRQLFWLSYANVWCTRYRPNTVKDLITTDPHTPNRFRVIGPLSNRPEFARDFNCPLGSFMNPVKKCDVW